MVLMQGRRHDAEHLDMKPGDYGRWKDNWICMTPNGLVGNLRLHNVVKHDDGSITVSPSILINGGTRGTYHGFLEHGVWREV
jgi:hypothetical protein